jgi:hypothetical protein
VPKNFIMKTKKTKTPKRENVIIGIYKITSPSNKVYIGQAKNLKRRWSAYFGIHEKIIGIKIKNSLKKHGITKHKFEIIEVCPPCKLDIREAFHKRKFIKEFGWELALFCQIKDSIGGYKSDETRLKISKALLGQKRSKEVIERMKKPRYKGWNKQLWKPILQLSLDNKIIKEWKSNKEASEKLKINKSCISDCCNSKRQNTAGGYKWKYKNN